MTIKEKRARLLDALADYCTASAEVQNHTPQKTGRRNALAYFYESVDR